MLEQLRRNSRSFIIWILFGIIIAVFIISFGPQANPESLGCGHSSEFALEVSGEDVPVSSWRYGVNGVTWLRLRGGSRDPAFRRQLALDLLVQRELLAQEAEKRGFRVPDDLVNKAIAAGEFYILGFKVRQGDKAFYRDYKQLEAYASNLGLQNVAQLIEEQRREHLAEMTRHLYLASASVSDEEVKNAYIRQNTLVSADYVKFDVDRYRNALSLGEEEIAKYAAENEAEIKKTWEAEKTQWTSDRARVLARHIFISKDPEPEATPGEKPADGKPDSKTEEDAAAANKKEEDKTAAATRASEEAKAVQARLAGGEDFAKVAREVSDDKLTKARGGLLGWRPAESLGYGKEVVEAVKKLDIGKVSEPIETPRGFHIVRVDERSEKALTFEQKKLDLAGKTAADHYARKLARRDAEAALAQARTKPLDQLFERKATPQEMPFPGGQLPENVTPEMLEQLLKDAGEAGEEGVIFREGPNVYAQAAGSTPTTQPSTPPPASKPPKPAAKPASEEPAPAAASTDGLPAVTVDKPGLESVGPAPRTKDHLAGVGESEELLTDLFEKIEVGKLADKVYEVSGPPDAFVIVQLKEREDADMTKFEAEKEELKSAIAYSKGVRRLAAWLMDRCVKSSKDGDIKINPSIIQDEDSGKQVNYQACATMNPETIAGQLMSRETP